jgi:hypothetical protein
VYRTQYAAEQIGNWALSLAAFPQCHGPVRRVRLSREESFRQDGALPAVSKLLCWTQDTAWVAGSS